ncbi:MAG: YfcE family phosphodiesterase [Eubacteriaceae bacterium]|jgi:putative phosphoesterase|nr:YfcE family phosphodiesterase [Eubacteriaceae bacterium]
MNAILVSDTHGDIASLSAILQLERDARLCLHAGDYARDLWLAGLPDGMKGFAVCGNCDGYSAGAPLFEILSLGATKIYLCHGHEHGVKSGELTELVDKALYLGCNTAVFGHTHLPLLENRSGVLLINPGAANPHKARGGLPGYALLELGEGGQVEGVRFKPL